MKTQSKVKIIKNVIIIILSFIAIICAMVETNYSEIPGTYVEDKYFGGDAYTDIQQAVADGANNTRSMNKNISHYYRSAMWIIAIAFGVLLVKSVFNIIEETVIDRSPVASVNVVTNSVDSEIEKERRKIEIQKRELEKQRIENFFQSVPENIKKFCPFCGEIVKSSKCDMCGKPNNLFDK